MSERRPPMLPADLEDDTSPSDWHERALRALADQLGHGNDFYYPLLGAAQNLTTLRARLAELEAENERLTTALRKIDRAPFEPEVTCGDRHPIRGLWQMAKHTSRAALAQPKESSDD